MFLAVCVGGGVGNSGDSVENHVFDDCSVGDSGVRNDGVGYGAVMEDGVGVGICMVSVVFGDCGRIGNVEGVSDNGGGGVGDVDVGFVVIVIVGGSCECWEFGSSGNDGNVVQVVLWWYGDGMVEVVVFIVGDGGGEDGDGGGEDGDRGGEDGDGKGGNK